MTPAPGDHRSASTAHAPDRADAAPSSGRARIAAPLVAAAFGVVFCYWVGAHVIDPTNVDWLLHRDWAGAYVGWEFFRVAQWRWPLGANPLYPDPIGSTIGFCDGLPIVAVALKPWARLLPADFQYIGPWLALCFALQGWWGARLTMTGTRSVPAAALGGVLFVVCPILLQRVLGTYTGHASLSTQWVILWLFWAHLAPCAGGVAARRRVLTALLLVFFASGIHPYLTTITATLTLALLVRLASDASLRVSHAAGYGLATIAVAAAGMLTFGYIGHDVTTDAGGFGKYSADVLTLVNPMGWSRLAGGWPTIFEQYEGFGYLGAGMILAVVAGPILAIARRDHVASTLWRRGWPAFVASLGLAVFALSGTIRIAGQPILEIRAYDLVPLLATSFRAGGRFIWPFHYALVTVAVLAIVTAFRGRPRVAVAILAVVVAVQLVDVRPPAGATIVAAPPAPLSPTWSLGRNAYARVIVYPPFLSAAGLPVAADVCGGFAYSHEHYVRAARIAFVMGATVNSAYLARFDVARAAAMCRQLYDDVRARHLDADAVYVVHPDSVAAIRDAGATCGMIDGLVACVVATRDDELARALRGSPTL